MRINQAYSLNDTLTENAMNKPRITNLRQLRKEFWETFPNLPHRRIKNEKTWPTDVRCAFIDWLEQLTDAGSITQEFKRKAYL